MGFSKTRTQAARKSLKSFLLKAFLIARAQAADVKNTESATCIESRAQAAKFFQKIFIDEI